MSAPPPGVQMFGCGTAHPLTWSCLHRLGAEHANRDDLARDVAREWATVRARPHDFRPADPLAAALDRLTAAYGVTP